MAWSPAIVGAERRSRHERSAGALAAGAGAEDAGLAGRERAGRAAVRGEWTRPAGWRPAHEPRLSLGYAVLATADVRFLTHPAADHGRPWAMPRSRAAATLMVLEDGQVEPPAGGAISTSPARSSRCPTSRSRPARAELRMRQRKRTLTAALSLLDQPPFRFMAKAGRPVELGEGRALLVETVLDLPLKAKVTPKDGGLHRRRARSPTSAPDVLVQGAARSPRPTLALKATAAGSDADRARGSSGRVPFDRPCTAALRPRGEAGSACGRGARLTTVASGGSQEFRLVPARGIGLGAARRAGVEVRTLKGAAPATDCLSQDLAGRRDAAGRHRAGQKPAGRQRPDSRWRPRWATAAWPIDRAGDRGRRAVRHPAGCALTPDGALDAGARSTGCGWTAMARCAGRRWPGAGPAARARGAALTRRGGGPDPADLPAAQPGRQRRRRDADLVALDRLQVTVGHRADRCRGDASARRAGSTADFRGRGERPRPRSSGTVVPTNGRQRRCGCARAMPAARDRRRRASSPMRRGGTLDLRLAPEARRRAIAASADITRISACTNAPVLAALLRCGLGGGAAGAAERRRPAVQRGRRRVPHRRPARSRSPQASAVGASMGVSLRRGSTAPAIADWTCRG
ncbi:MAG: hypothetical protein MZV49_24995 [Rhodopseudomonas palustris]|nr:hypothetical protein [Rhodopseudomonas palustris]